MEMDFSRSMEPAVVLQDGSLADGSRVRVLRSWENNCCRSKLVNDGLETVQIKEILLFSIEWLPPPGTTVYGEGYSKLSQYSGTPSSVKSITPFSDGTHYKLPQAPEGNTVYNLLLAALPGQEHLLLSFASCRRFGGQFRFSESRLDIVLDMEGLKLHPGECWELEEFFHGRGGDRDGLLEQLAAVINKEHPRLAHTGVPMGWCSWYCYGPDIKTGDIIENMEEIKRKLPGLNHIQIDDGYQPRMGDWLEPNAGMEGDIQSLCREIEKHGFEPAIWVAPFIAEEGSKLLKEHPDWFVGDGLGKPLRSDGVTYGGWRCGPWYMLDGSNPHTQEHFKKNFRHMRAQWGCRYFKLDALMWGAIPAGSRFDEGTTCIEAYRRGMNAILEGAGEDSFILGCNAPMWPSLGRVHGMRVSGDIDRSWESIRNIAREVFSRNWQHNRLWVNDPDCIVLENRKLWGEAVSRVTEEEFLFHAGTVLASGGMVLSGDRISNLSRAHVEKLRRLMAMPKKAAGFVDPDFRTGKIEMGDTLVLCLFNWEEEAVSREVALPGRYEVLDFWNNEPVGIFDGLFKIHEIKAHSSRIYICNKLTKD